MEYKTQLFLKMDVVTSASTDLIFFIQKDHNKIDQFVIENNILGNNRLTTKAILT